MIRAENDITLVRVDDGIQGEPGADGYSPTVTTGTSSDGSTTVKVTNKDGSTTTTLVDGKARADIDNLSDKTRSGYIETLSGSGFVQSTKTEDGGASEVVVYGKSNQKVTQQSANLCPTYDKWTLSGGAYIDGDYIVFPSNGATAVVDVHWKKASNILYFYIDSKRDSDDAASLIIKSDNGNGWATELQTDETTYSGSFGGNNVYGDTLLGMRYVRLTLMHYQSTTGSMRIKNFMVSSTNTIYVPFVPDSPSPEYPSEIQSVENPKVTACGKNLIDRSKNTMNSYIEQDTGIMISSATAASYNAEATDFIPVEVGEPYYYSGYIDVNIGNTGAMYDDNKNFVAPIISDSDIAPLVVPNGVSYIRLTIWGIYYENGDKSVAQLEKGSTPTYYEPYKGKTATLSDIVLRSTPDGTRDKVFKDSDGLWKVERNVKSVVFDGVSNGKKADYMISNTTLGHRWYINGDPLRKKASTQTMLCSHLKWIRNGSDSNTLTENNTFSEYSGTYNYYEVYFRTDSLTTLDEVNEWLASLYSNGTPMELIYPLATPTYETLPTSIQEELNALTTYNPITNVMVSDGVTPDIDVSFWTRDYRTKNIAESIVKRVVIDDDSVDIVDSTGRLLASYGDKTEIYDASGKAQVSLGATKSTISGFDIVPLEGGHDYFKSDWEASDGNFYRTWIRSADNTDLGQTWAFSAQMKNQNDGNLYGGFIAKSNGDTFIGPKDATGADAGAYFRVTKDNGIQIYPNKTVTKQPNLYWVSSGTTDSNRLCYTRWSASSEQIKDEIKSIENTELNPQNLYDVNVVQFKYKPDVLEWDDERHGKELIGFIIEDLNEKYPIAVDKADEYDSKTWNWNSAYMIPAMLKLIQEQHKEIEELKELMKGNK